MNILEIVVIIFVIGMAMSGFRRGFVKKLASMLSLVLSVTLVSAALPYVTEFLKTDTPLYSYIVEQCENVVTRLAVSALTETSAREDNPGSDEAGDNSWSENGTAVLLSGTFGSENGIAVLLSGTSGSENGTAVLLSDTSGSENSAAVLLSGTSGCENGTAALSGGTSGALSETEDFAAGAAAQKRSAVLTLSTAGSAHSSAVFCSGLSIGRDEIKSLLEQYGYDGSIIDSLTDEELEQYVQQYIQQYLGGDSEAVSVGGTGSASGSSDTGNTDTAGASGSTAAGSTGSSTAGQDLSDILTSLDVSSVLTSQDLSLDKNTQMEIIDNLPVPEFLKDLLITYNNDEGYESLQVDTFQEYVIRFIATAILNVISFVVSVILVQLLLWIIIKALNIFSRLPVIRGVNHLAGLALGLMQALFFLWIFFLLLTMLQATEIGQELMAMVTQSEGLSWLYESNLFLKIVFQTAALFQ